MSAHTVNNANQFDSIDDLFAAARDSEREIVDDNFTKLVINQLPVAPRRINSTRWSLDLFATLVAVAVAMMFFDARTMFAQLFNQSSATASEVMKTAIGSGADIITLFGSQPLLMSVISASVITTVSLIAWFAVEYRVLSR